MTCEETDNALVDYHFGVLEAQSRAKLEAHLLTCPRCVGAFVSLKRAIETSTSDVAPSPDARARLRRAVADELRVAHSPRRSWDRPLAWAVAACALLVASAATELLTSSPPSPPRALVGAAR